MICVPELVSQVDEIFAYKLKAPPPPEIMRDRMVALQNANLQNQYNSLYYESRCWQAEQLGFKKITIEDMFQALTISAMTVTMPAS